MPTLIIPESLTKYSYNKQEILVIAHNFSELAHFLSKHYPNLYKVLYNETSTLNQFASFILNNKLIHTQNLPTIDLEESDIIMIIVAIAGG